MELRQVLLLGTVLGLPAAQKEEVTDVCALPAEKGPCAGYIAMFYYSPRSQSCQGFIYGGCGGNENRFPTLEMCVWSCVYNDICRLPVNRGRCQQRKTRYFYNHANQTCERFVYSGCRGNRNRFPTLEECQRTCLHPEICQLPMDSGTCRAHVPFYYYEPRNQSCVRFLYGGCQGNRNRFPTLEQCEHVCRHPDVCVLPPDTGPCSNYSRRFHYSPATQKCLPFPYGGCRGNANRFPTLEECRETCSRKDICRLPKDPGPCAERIPRFYYDSLSQTCEEFVYGGCGGNSNRFETQTECVWRCRNPDICRLPPETGSCRAPRLRYSYNPDRRRCDTFTYSGCKGNENRFATLQECRHACAKPNLCRLPLDRGQGNGSIPMYYYNPDKQVCAKSAFRGRQGNANRFASRAECRETCRDPDICQLPKEPGPCEARIPSFYYNSTSRLCTEFNYGGCKGNQNRFASQEECQRVCRGPAPWISNWKREAGHDEKDPSLPETLESSCLPE
ncbi:papilin-like [Paroedura picta]|uniref:papilin-like n=1 Tax=Paroedura picta TaxID=143630 RepID=UPI004056A819